MATETAPVRTLARFAALLGPRGGVVLLVAAQFLLAIVQTWTLPPQWFPASVWGLESLLTDAQEAIPQAQLTLIGAYLMLGGGRWVPRIVRGILLLLWLELAHMIGTQWLAGGRDAAGFMFFLGTNAWNLTFLVLPLLIYRLLTRRRLVLPGAAEPGRFQFRIWQLLLVTTEAAALLATIRAFVAENNQWHEELWMAIRTYLLQYASFDSLALTILSGIPAVLVTLRVQSVWRAATWLGLWQLLLSIGFLFYRMALPELDPNFPVVNMSGSAWEWFVCWLRLLAICLIMGIIIWPSLVAVRSLGYEFLRPRRGGRQSSDATSAA
jgi:hypothetical protein